MKRMLQHGLGWRLGRSLCLIGLIAVLWGGVAQPAAGQVPVARLRVAHYVIDAQPVAVYIDGVLVAGDPLPFRRATAYADYPTGAREVAIAPSDGTIADAYITTTVELVGGHDHTLALIGLLAEATVETLLLNDTAILGVVRDPQSPASYAVLLHAISNGPAIDFYFDGERLMSGLAYREYDVVIVEEGAHDVLVTFADDPDSVLFANSGETAPSNDLLLLTVMTGSYPDDLAVSGAVSRLEGRTALDFLRDYEGEDSFETFRALLALSRREALLDREGVFTVFAPTDAAFSALPAETLARLLADADAAGALVDAHIVEDNFNTRYMESPATLTTVAGSTLVVTGDESEAVVNDTARILFGGFPAIVNGNVIALDAVIVTPAG